MTHHFITLLRVLAALLISAPLMAVAQVNGFYRYPTLRGDQVWFTAEGDIWRVPSSGGRAERVTTHPGNETRAAVSPDGGWLAFTGAYEGPVEAYVMAVGGGLPKRLTYGGQNVQVNGWTPNGEVVVVSPSSSGAPNNQLFAIDPSTLARRPFPVALASDGAVSSDGKTLYFTRYGLRNDNVRGYRGGAMARLWALDVASTQEARPLLDATANARRPMPYTANGQARIAFLSDRSGSYEIWSSDAAGAALHQHTRSTGFEVRYASLDASTGSPRVVYAIGADLHLVDLSTDADRLIEISLGGDFDQQRTRWIKQPQPYLSSVRLAPDGERAALTARGRIATQGVAALRRAELPVPPGARCREAVFSHDSRSTFAWCDSSGEYEIWRFAANGSGSPVQITHGAASPQFALFPSPDGQWIAHFDRASRLVLTSLSGQPGQGANASRVVDTPKFTGEASLTWSPDSRALAFTRPDATPDRSQLMLFTMADSKRHVLSSDRYDSSAPAFTPDGKWLYFLSDRAFTSSNTGPWGDRNLGPYFDKRTRVYALALQPGSRFPFQPHDELEGPVPRNEASTTVTTTVTPAGAASVVATSVAVQISAAPAASAAASASQPKSKLPAIVVDGLAERLYEVPMPAGNYTWIDTDGKRLYVLEGDGAPERKTSLRTLAIDNTGPTLELFAPDVKSFELTPDGKKLMLVRSTKGPETGDVLIVDAGPKLAPDVAKNQVRWNDWQIRVEPRAEWKQMFDDAWRLHRDTFYDANMLGVDWAAAKRRHEPLLARVTDRDELNELLAEMVSELHTLHSQVATRDLRQGNDEIGAAGIGGRFSKVADGFRIEQVYRSDAELPSEAAPLAQARAKPGDTITAVNGRSTAAVADLSELLRGQAGRQVLLTLKGGPSKPREVVVTPVAAVRERQLATGDWEAGRAERALARSNGHIGYLRLRAMGPADIATFAREFYANVDRDGLIIDVRGNNGGNIDSWVIERLMRRAWAFWQPRYPAGTPPSSNMQNAFRGHLAVLVDEETYSDGETFAEGIKRLQLGTLIGKRTSGAGVWLSDRNRLQDNGIMRAAEDPVFALDGTWLVEGKGVTPDIEVDNLPRATFDGNDAQLDAAIAHLQRRLAEQPIASPVPPPR